MQIGLSSCFTGCRILGILGGHCRIANRKCSYFKAHLNKYTQVLWYILYIYITSMSHLLLYYVVRVQCLHPNRIWCLTPSNLLDWIAKTKKTRNKSLPWSPLKPSPSAAQRVWCWTKIGLGGSAQRRNGAPRTSRGQSTRFRSREHEISLFHSILWKGIVTVGRVSLTCKSWVKVQLSELCEPFGRCKGWSRCRW